MELQDQIFEAISKQGFNPVRGNVYIEMAKWKSWYRGNVNDFHSYNLKTISGNTTSRKRLSLQMGKKVCEDWATLLFNEEVEMNIKDDDALNDQVQEVLQENNFRVEFSGLLEKTFALGTGVLIEFIQDGEVMIDYITGDNIIVTSYRNQKINGICAVNAFEQNGYNITHLAYHTFKKGVYEIVHKTYASDEKTQLGKAVPISSVFNTELSDEPIRLNVKQPHFQVIKPNIANNFDLENPMGLSVIANSIDSLMGADKKYDSFMNEYDAARHRILLDSEFTKTQLEYDETSATQRFVNYFDSEQMEFQAAPMGNSDKKIEFFNAPIRAEEHYKGISTELQLIGFKSGLGTDYYAFDARGVYQNEKAIISENSDLWANKKKHEIILTKALRGMIKAIAYLLTNKELTDDDVDIKLADSIIIDDEALKEADKDLMDRGMMAKYQYLMKWYGMTEDEAKKQIHEAEEETTASMSFEDNVPEDVDGAEDNPFPKPLEMEDMETFMQRFMGSPRMKAEYPDEDQRLAIANKVWQERMT